MRRHEHKRINSQTRASFWYIASNIISRGVGFLFTPIFTRLLTPEEYGVHSIYVSFMGIFTVLSTLEISGAVAYRGIAKFEDSCDSFISSALGAQCLFSLAATTLYIIFKKPIDAISHLGTELTLLLLLQVFLNSAEGLFFAKCRYFGDYRTVSLINIGAGLFTPPLSFFLIKLGFGGEARVIAPLAVSFIIVLPISVMIIKRGRRLFSGKVLKFITGLALPMLPHYLSLSVIAQSDKIVTARLLGDGAVGKYSAAHSIGLMLSLVTGGLTLALTPWIMRKLKNGGQQCVEKTLTSALRLVGISIPLFLTVVPEVFKFLLSASYGEALIVTYIIAASVLFSFLASILSSCILSFDKPMLITKNTVICAAISIIGALILTSRLGYVGAAASTLLSYFTLFVLNLSTAKSVTGRSFINVNQGLRAFFLVLFFSSVAYALRESMLARLFILLALLFMLLPELARTRKLIF